MYPFLDSGRHESLHALDEWVSSGMRPSTSLRQHVCNTALTAVYLRVLRHCQVIPRNLHSYDFGATWTLSVVSNVRRDERRARG